MFPSLARPLDQYLNSLCHLNMKRLISHQILCATLFWRQNGTATQKVIYMKHKFNINSTKRKLGRQECIRGKLVQHWTHKQKNSRLGEAASIRSLKKYQTRAVHETRKSAVQQHRRNGEGRLQSHGLRHLSERSRDGQHLFNKIPSIPCHTSCGKRNEGKNMTDHRALR